MSSLVFKFNCLLFAVPCVRGTREMTLLNPLLLSPAYWPWVVVLFVRNQSTSVILFLVRVCLSVWTTFNENLKKWGWYCRYELVYLSYPSLVFIPISSLSSFFPVFAWGFLCVVYLRRCAVICIYYVRAHLNIFSWCRVLHSGYLFLFFVVSFTLISIPFSLSFLRSPFPHDTLTLCLGPWRHYLMYVTGLHKANN